MSDVLGLDAHLEPLRAVTEPVSRSIEAPSTELAPGVWLHCDPQAEVTGHWTSPAGRLLELTLAPAHPGAWAGLHITLPAFETGAFRWLAVALRAHASGPMALRPCLRSGTDQGFVDTFFEHYALIRPAESDHHGLLAPDRHPDLPPVAPWRELVLFLPPGEAITLSLHELRIHGL